MYFITIEKKKLCAKLRAFFLFFLFFSILLLLFFNFTILYWFCHSLETKLLNSHLRGETSALSPTLPYFFINAQLGLQKSS